MATSWKEMLLKDLDDAFKAIRLGHANTASHKIKMAEMEIEWLGASEPDRQDLLNKIEEAKRECRLLKERKKGLLKGLEDAIEQGFEAYRRKNGNLAGSYLADAMSFSMTMISLSEDESERTSQELREKIEKLGKMVIELKKR